MSTDPSNKQVNAEAFQAWYGMMTDVVTNQQRVPRHLLDEYNEQVWFGVIHRHTFLQPTCVSETTFHMAPLRFQLNDDTFHREVSAWPGVVKHVRDGITRYNFDRMLPAQRPAATGAAESSQVGADHPQDAAETTPDLPKSLVSIVEHLNGQVRRLNVATQVA